MKPITNPNDVVMPDDRFVDSVAVTLGEFQRRRFDVAEHPQHTVAEVMAPTPAAPFDDFTLDAEILVERFGLALLTSDDLASLLGISESTVKSRVGRGQLPAARISQPSRWAPHRWTAAQAVEILAERLRYAAYVGDMDRTDDFTTEAERLVAASHLFTFSTANLAALLGVAESTIRGRRARGLLPVAENGRWTVAQAAAILARELRARATAA